MVMYAGRQAELGTVDEVFYESRHPYTLGLIGSIPRLDHDNDEPPIPIPGSPPSPITRTSGCPFHPRCAFSAVPGRCDTQVPGLPATDPEQPTPPFPSPKP